MSTGWSSRFIAAGQVFRSAVHLVFPETCAVCRHDLDRDVVPFFCDLCWSMIEPLRGPACPRCHLPFKSPAAIVGSPTHTCGACRARPPAFTQAWGLYPLQSPLQDALWLYKYHGKVSLAPPLARLFATAFPSSPSADVIAPVPLSPERLRHREYNQSLLLAAHLSRSMNLPLSYGNLIRVKDTEAQTTLTRAARLRNLRRAFHVVRPEQFEGRRVFLVDDVMTTGTTLNECAKTLRKAGAGDVYALALARAVPIGTVPDFGASQAAEA